MDYRTWILGLVLVLILTNPAGAKVQPSFDCAKATTEVEKLICSDDELAKLDVEMNKWYRKEIIENLHLRFDEKLCLGEDFEFNTRYFSGISSMGLIAAPYYIYLLKETGLSGKFQPEIWKIRDTLYTAHEQLYSTLQISNECSRCVRKQAGQIAFGDIRTINSKNCFYGHRDKIKFVFQMMKSDQYPLILEYLKSADKWKLRIYYYIFRLCNPTILWMVILAEGKLLKR